MPESVRSPPRGASDFWLGKAGRRCFIPAFLFSPMKLQSYQPLCLHTTLRTGGLARWFLEAKTDTEIKAGVILAQKNSLPLLILGGGSNVLASDAGFPGLVIKVATSGLELREPGESAPLVTEVVAEAGEEWDALVAFSIEHGLYGLENLSLIPGRVGAAVIGNIGAYGTEVKDTLLWVEALDCRSLAVRRFTLAECDFGYRRSVFKSREGRHFIVLRAAFGLRTQGTVNTGYRDVAEWFATRGIAHPTPAEVREAVVTIRQSKMPDLSVVGCAGSFFKNPVIARADYERLAARYPGLPGHAEPEDRVKVPLAWILDKVCGLRGVRQGPVGTHEEQALVIVNQGGTSVQVEAFANGVSAKVREMTGIEIEWEVEKI